jgi:hypothetical protein
MTECRGGGRVPMNRREMGLEIWAVVRETGAPLGRNHTSDRTTASG